MDQYIGKILDNRYEILEVIGVGGMAVVYKAMDRRLNRRVAVKILKDEFLNDAEFRRRFHAESLAVAMMSHPNIVNVYDVSKNDMTDYIVMELIDGITLKQYMERKGMLSWRETLHFAMQIAKALEHAHSRNIIHRDIKPHNIMILKDGSVKVADFGIARVASAQNTLTKEALGSVHYISPEQARGARVDNRTDIYSLGVVMYQMLTGRPPYDGDSPVSVAIQHINGTPLLPSLINSNIPTGLEQITMHAMCSDISKRYASAADMLRDMEEFRKNPGAVFSFAPDGSTAAVTRPPLQSTTPIRQGAEPRQLRHATQADYDAEERASRRKIILTAALVILGLVILIGVGSLLLRNSGGISLPTEAPTETETKKVKVPNLLGTVWEDVHVTDYPGLEFILTNDAYVYNNAYPEGTVCDQSIQGGTEVDPGTKLEIKISLGEQTDKLPDFNRKSLEYTENYLKNIETNVRVTVEEIYDDSVPEGFVVVTDPGAGDSVKNGDTVTIYVSLGKETRPVEVPDVRGNTLENARSVLTGLKLSVYVFEDYSASVPAGSVITQSPAPATEVDEGAVITLTVSKGPQTTPVANVTGMDSDTAKATLESQGFVVNIFEQYNLMVPAGQVISQDPAASTELEQGAVVTIYVSLGTDSFQPLFPEPPAPDEGGENNGNVWFP